jgi:hypothetical protein
LLKTPFALLIEAEAKEAGKEEATKSQAGETSVRLKRLPSAVVAGMNSISTIGVPVATTLASSAICADSQEMIVEASALQ